MPLQSDDLLLVNRKVGNEWKAFKIPYETFLEEIEGGLDLEIPSAGFVGTDAFDPNGSDDELKFDTEPDNQDTVDMTRINQFRFHSSMTEVLKGQQGEKIQVYVIDTGTKVTYGLTADAATDASGAQVLYVDYVESSDPSPSLTKGESINIRPLGSSGTGDGLEISVCPPGMEEDTSTGKCVVDNNFNYDTLTPGSLWYNPRNGVTYTWYLNEADFGQNSKGQWADVRPPQSK